MSQAGSDSELVAELAEEFVERYRRGERPRLQEYIGRHPHLADEINEVFPALVLVENLAPENDASIAGAGSDQPAIDKTPAIKQLGDYRIIREVGRGGMGIVYEAEQVSLGRHVALKVLPQELLATPKHRMRFEREAKAAAKLHHTNIVPVFGVGRQDEMGYYVMQFIQGLALDEVLDELKRMKVRPDSSGGSLRSGELRVSRREVSAADVAHSLMTGAFHPPADDPSPASEAKNRTGEAAVEGGQAHIAQSTSLNEPVPGDETIVQDLARGAAALQADSPTTKSGRSSESFSLSDSSVVLLGAAKGRSDKSTGKRNYWESVAHIGLQTAEALDYAHGQGVLHRDIKPSNLMLDIQGVVWVTDFGLAKLDDDRGLTETGDVLGTLRYMAPETFKGESDARSELYSLGLTLYELLAFRPAFDETNRKTLIDQVLSADIEPLAKLNPDIPRDLVTIVHKAIERDPAHRYQTAQELADDLQRFVDDDPIKARRVSAIESVARWSRRNRGLATSLAVVCALLLVINIAGPILTLRMLDLNRNLQGKQSALNQTITQLEATGWRLQSETTRANQQADAATRLAEEKGRLALNEAAARADTERQKSFARRSQYTASLLAARHALTTPEGYSRAMELLDEVRPQGGETDLRGWEWFYLHSQRTPGELVLAGFDGSANAVEYSPDGKLLAAGDLGGSTRIFDADRGALLKTFAGERGSVRTLTWSPDSARLATAGGDKSVRIWNVDVAAEELRLHGHEKSVMDVAWSPDGARLASGGLDGLIKIWDAATGENLRTIDAKPGLVRGVDWSPDGRRLVSSAGEKVCLWDADTGQSLHVMEGHSSRVVQVRFSPDGRRVASASWQKGDKLAEKPVIIWDSQQGTELLVLDELAYGVRTVCWSPDGGKLAAAGRDASGEAAVWDAETGKLLHTFTGRPALYQDCSWSRDGKRLAAASKDKVVHVWDVVQRNPPPDFAGHAGTPVSLEWSPDGSRIATASLDKTVKIWDVGSKQELLNFDRHTDQVYCVAWSPGGRLVASCGAESVLHIWEPETGYVRRTIRASLGGPIRWVAWSPDESMIATAADDKTVRIFDVASGDQVQQIRLNVFPLSVDFSRDGRQLAAGSLSGDLVVWDVATGRETARALNPGSRYWNVQFSPDGALLAAGGTMVVHESSLVFGDGGSGKSASLSLWNLKSSRATRQLRGHTKPITSLDWSDDGARLLSAAWDGRMILWDAATGGQLLAIDDPDEKAVRAVRFSPDELQFASAGNARGIRLWDATAAYAAELSPKLLTSLDNRIDLEPTIDDLVLRGRILAAQGKWRQSAANLQQAAALRPPGGQAAPWIETSWWVAGPYPMSLEQQQPPEAHLDPHQPIPFVADSGLPPRHWMKAHLTPRQGLNLGRIFAGAHNISAYATTRVFSSKEQSVGLLFGADDQARIWLNGAVVHTHETMSRAIPDDDVVEITLVPGWNTLLFKVSNNTLAHGLFARLSRDPRDLARAFDRNQRWDKALAYWELAREDNPRNSFVLFSHGRAALKTGRQQLAEESFAQAIELMDDKTSAYRTMARLYFEDAQALLVSGDSEQAASSLEISRQLYQQSLESDSASEQDAAGLADVLLAMNQTEWSVLKPVEMKSAGGATLTPKADGSVLAHGPLVSGDVYTIRAPVDGKIHAIRLEALPDPSLPAQGPGRLINGNFQLESFRVYAASGNDGAPANQRPLANASASYAYEASDVNMRGTIEEGDPRVWHVYGRAGERHVAYFELAAPLQVPAGQPLIVQCAHKDIHGGVNLGRFRLSVSDDPTAFNTVNQHAAISRIEHPWARLVAACAAVGDGAQAAAWFTKALEQTPEFAARRELVASMDRLGTDFSKLAALRPDEPLVLDVLARRQRDAGDTEAAAQSLSKARRLTEALLAESPDEEPLAGFLADLLLADTAAWSVPEPIELTSAGGAALERQQDGSILASGLNPDDDLYTVVLPLTSENVNALRLETLADGRLPFASSGRSPINGNFHLAELSLSWRSADDPTVETPVQVTRAFASVDGSEGRVIVRAIDGDRTTHWTPHPQQHLDHAAVFEFQATPAMSQQGGQLVVRLDTGVSSWGQHGLGRFRISVTEDPRIVAAEARRLAVSRIDNPWARLGAAFATVGESKRAALWSAKAIGQMPNSATRAELIELIDQPGVNLDDLIAQSPDSELLELLRFRRRFGESADAASDEKLAAEFFEFLEQTAPRANGMDLRSLLEMREFESVVDQPRFERLLEKQLAMGAGIVRQGIWTKQPIGVWWQWTRLRDDLEALIAQNHSQQRRPRFLSAGRWLRPPGQYFTTIWTQDGKKHRIEPALSRRQFDALLDAPPDGMQLASVEEFVDGEATLYAALWVEQETPSRWELHERLSESETVALSEKMRQQGYRPTYVNVYPDGTLTTIWVESNRETELLLGLTYWDLKKLERERADACLPTCIDSYFDGERRRYAVILDLSVAGAQWKFTLLERGEELQSAFESNAGIGWNHISTTESTGFAPNAQQRAIRYMRAGQWKLAAADYAQSVETDPKANSIAWIKPAALWAYSGDAVQHRLYCQRMFERFRGAEERYAPRTAKVMLLREEGLDVDHPVFERFLARFETDAVDTRGRAWSLSTRALLECRRGDFSAAQQTIDEAQRVQRNGGYGRNSTHALFSLAVQGLIGAKAGETAKAREVLNELQSQLASQGLKWGEDGSLDGGTVVGSYGGLSHDLLMPEVLRREALSLVQDSTDNSPADEGRSADDGEENTP